MTNYLKRPYYLVPLLSLEFPVYRSLVAILDRLSPYVDGAPERARMGKFFQFVKAEMMTRPLLSRTEFGLQQPDPRDRGLYYSTGSQKFRIVCDLKEDLDLLRVDFGPINEIPTPRLGASLIWNLNSERNISYFRLCRAGCFDRDIVEQEFLELFYRIFDP